MKQKIRYLILVILTIFSYNFFSSKNFLTQSFDNNFFLIDTSYSMWTIEKWKSRLDQAKDFILKNAQNNIQIESFWEEKVISFPLSKDKSLLKPILDQIKLGTISQWENIITTLEQTISQIKNHKWKNQIIVLTDWWKGVLNFENLEKRLIENNLHLLIIWIWTQASSNLELMDSSGQSRQVKDKWQLVSTSQNISLKWVSNIKNWFYKDINQYYLPFLNYEIIIFLLIILYLWTYVKLK